MITEILDSTTAQMEKTLAALHSEFSTIRTGRANANVLDHIKVDYYGTPTPVTQLAGIKSPEAHMLVIEPWDKSVLHAIEKAILSSDLGITPNSDGSVIRLPFPAPTEERRRELVKQCHSVAEDARVAIRNARRDANGKMDRAKKDGDISEDEMHRSEAEVQKMTDRYIARIDELLKGKETEVMEV